ncbi:MAG: AsnC family transcriptional regulator [Methanosarcinales archaeon]|nr:AsnC family transcriptional regulator [ANME-2 cluster archaeon]MDW7774998.1 AsnC family transcriptional regulator [Methanosarcinales archaeon]
MIELDDLDKAILNEIQVDFPLTEQPFRELAENLGSNEDEVINRIKRLIKEGAIRRIGPILNVKNTGGESTLAAVKAPEERIDEVANMISSYDEVSHNYLRPAEYNIWFTVSAPTKERLGQILEEIETRTGCPLIDLPTLRLFKIGVKFNIK